MFLIDRTIVFRSNAESIIAATVPAVPAIAALGAECYKISNSTGVRKLRSNAQQQPNSIESQPLITYNLNKMQQALRPVASN